MKTNDMMMNHQLKELSTKEMEVLNGGASFAYRVGSTLRFLAKTLVTAPLDHGGHARNFTEFACGC